MTPDDFMRRAIALGAACRKADGDRPFGAVIVRDGRIIGEGRNEAGSLKDPTAHSEMTAIRAASARLGSADLAGTEIYTSGEPCPMCAAAIAWAGIGRVIYAASGADAAALALGFPAAVVEAAKPIAARSIPAARLLADEAVAMMAAWDRP